MKTKKTILLTGTLLVISLGLGVYTYISISQKNDSNISTEIETDGLGGKKLPLSFPTSYATSQASLSRSLQENIEKAQLKYERLINEGLLKIEKREDLNKLIGGDWYYYENTRYVDMKVANISDKVKRDEKYANYFNNSSRPSFHEEYINSIGETDPTPIAYWYEDRLSGKFIEFAAYTPVYTIDDIDLMNRLIQYIVDMMNIDLREQGYNLAHVTVGDRRSDAGYEGKRFVNCMFTRKTYFGLNGHETPRQDSSILISSKEEGYNISTYYIDSL